MNLAVLGDAVVADSQVGAVCGKPCLGRTCDAGGKVSAGGRCAVKHNLRLIFMNQITDYPCVAVCLVMFEQQMLG